MHIHQILRDRNWSDALVSTGNNNFYAQCSINLLDKSLQGRDARIAGIVTSGMCRSGSSKPKGAAINVSPDPGLRQIVRRGHGGQYQDGSERFCFFTV